MNGPESGWRVRLAGLAVSLACLSVLLVAWGLTPDPAGHGTHGQLGMPVCGWLVAFGRPCGTCGMTTAFACAADGDVVGAARAQPLGAVLALGASAAFWGGLHVAATGARVDRLAGGWLGWKVLAGAVAVFLAAWGYKLATWES